MLGCSSLIGPPQAQCWNCNRPISLNKAEWPEMSALGRAWFLGVTVVYIFMLGMLTGMLFENIELLRTGQEGRYHPNRESPTYQTGFWAAGIAVVLLQAYRIIASYRRHRSEYKFTLREYLLGVQWNLQLKCLILLALIWVIAEWVYGW
jgi:hypothetical protein